MSNYLGMAKALDELMLELIGQGTDIPGNVADSLKSGRSLAGVALKGSCEGDTAARVMSTLESVEMNLLSLAESACGRDYAEKWQQKINDAMAIESSDQSCAPSATATRYNSGVPRGEYWIRVKESELAPVSNELEGLLDSFMLKALPQDDGYLMLYGKKENVSSFLKDIRDKERQRHNI